jgi:uncharacterized membrane protein
MRRSLLLLGGSVVNLIHFSTHIVQFVQSMLLIEGASHLHEDESALEHVLHHPLMMGLWGLIGLVSFVIGVKDVIHHKKCSHA